jgi:hypothetical protein
LSNLQLLCHKHHRIKARRFGPNASNIGIHAISVEAAIVLIDGLNDSGKNLLKAMAVLGEDGPIPRQKLLLNPDFELAFTSLKSLNGALTGIRRKFSFLFAEAFRLRTSLFQFEFEKSLYHLHRFACSSIMEAFKYLDNKESFEKNWGTTISELAPYATGTAQIVREVRVLRKTFTVASIAPQMLKTKELGEGANTENFIIRGEIWRIKFKEDGSACMERS